ncbi:YlbL family protein [Corynebacterium fournieri]|uniref:YlbL family protein n=1 Tax=Corynebacterium fournieri TaxID=1852390 RepID=UPI000A2F0AAD|nr:PDZ domain-containing protein [Corynebacterium fournieri]WJY96981.1 Lon protease [Corynebacterium fournieri]
MSKAREARNRRWSTLVWGSIPVVLLAGALTADHIPGTDIRLTVPYAAEGPGPMFDTLGEVGGEPVVDVVGAETLDTGGQLNMTTVSVRTNMTLGQALGRWIATDDTIVPVEQIMPPDLDEEQVREANQQAFVASEASATVAAMHYLDRPTTVAVHDVVEGSASDGILQPGDLITAVAGKPETTPGGVQEAVRAMEPGEEVEVTVERDGAERTETVTLGENPHEKGQPMLGILMTSEPAGGLHVNYNLNDIGGPSAGMMFSLAVIDKLTPGALNGGKFVAGTGTINEDGEVGPIGGIEHKLRAAEDEGAELFLAPAGNCDAVKRVHTEHMTVAKVGNLTEAVDALEDYAAGRDVPSC